jgi:hypothetical protein
MRTRASEPELVCPQCGERFGEAERFCSSCRLPLVLDAPAALAHPTEAQRWARKVKPQLSEGGLVKVAWARNQSEGEFLQGLLLEEGVPSMLRRSAGFDVPDFLAAGPRDVMVPVSGVDTARQILLSADLLSEEDGSPSAVAPARLLASLLGALALGVLVIWLISLALH